MTEPKIIRPLLPDEHAARAIEHYEKNYPKLDPVHRRALIRLFAQELFDALRMGPQNVDLPRNILYGNRLGLKDEYHFIAPCHFFDTVIMHAGTIEQYFFTDLTGKGPGQAMFRAHRRLVREDSLVLLLGVRVFPAERVLSKAELLSVARGTLLIQTIMHSKINLIEERLALAFVNEPLGGIPPYNETVRHRMGLRVSSIALPNYILSEGALDARIIWDTSQAWSVSEPTALMIELDTAVYERRKVG